MIRKEIVLFTTIIFLTIFLSGTKQIKSTNNMEKNIICIRTSQADKIDKKLTVMVYCDADNDLEDSILQDIQEMKDGYIDNPNLNIIVLVDRNSNYSQDLAVLGENFSDTRMYKIEEKRVIRIDGGTMFPEITKKSTYEANMGDANTLKKFIDSCKEKYQADKYVLIIAGHGTGAKDVCSDETSNGDSLYTAEVSDVLTNEESIDVLAYDACFMGTAEVAYQYRPGNGGFQSKLMIASPSRILANGYDYKKIFSRLKSTGKNNGDEDLTLGGKEQFFDPSTVTNSQIGAIIIESQRDFDDSVTGGKEAFSCFDLTKIENVKISVDKLAVSLWKENNKTDIETIRGTEKNVSVLHYFLEDSKREWLSYPYFDLYDLCKHINISSKFSDNIKKLAMDVMKNTDDMIIYSCGGSKLNEFTEGKNGISIFLPDGNKIYRDFETNTSYPEWKYQNWYNSIDTTTIKSEYLYGKLSWCIDGQETETNKVGNWFELLDSWFDTSNDKHGGENEYQW